MAELEMQTPEGVVLRLELAGAGSRFGAALVDLVAYLVAWTGLVTGLFILTQIDGTGLSEFAFQFMALGGLVLLWVIVLVVLHLALQGRTPGKMLFDLRVVGEEGHPASGMQLVLRSVLWPVDVVPIPISLGLLAMVVGPRNQRLGDMVAGTLVVHEPRRRGASEPWPRERYEDLQLQELKLTPALAARFDGEDLEYLRDVITRRGMGADGRAALYGQVARHYLGRLGQEGRVAPRVALKELYLFLREQRGGGSV